MLIPRIIFISLIIYSCQSEAPKNALVYKDAGILKNKKVFKQCAGTYYTNGTDKEYTAIAKNDDVLIRDEDDMSKINGRLKINEKVKVTGWQYSKNTSMALISRDTLIARGARILLSATLSCCKKEKRSL